MPLKPNSRKVHKQVCELYLIPLLLHQLNHIKLQGYGKGKITLLDVSQKDCELVAALGLFDSAQKVHDLFTLKSLKEAIERG